MSVNSTDAISSLGWVPVPDDVEDIEGGLERPGNGVEPETVVFGQILPACERRANETTIRLALSGRAHREDP